MMSCRTPYKRRVEQWVRAALSKGATSIEEIVEILPGVYPSIVRNVLLEVAPQIQERTQHLTRQHLLWPPSIRGDYQEVPLPAPHPLDYDWRFHDDAIKNILERIDMLTAPGDTVILLGTPSILHATLHAPQPYQLILLEANSTMVTWFAEVAPTACVHHCIIGRDALPQIAGSVVVADPPWHEEHIRAFLWAAARLCLIGGTILMSVPPIGTRPGIAEEWERTLDWAERLGLVLTKIERGILAYETPPFEHNALRAEGLPTITRAWRHGDLAIFTCQHKYSKIHLLLPAPEGIWDEVCVDGVRVRLRRQQSIDFIDPTLIPLVDDHILPSVSRRDPRRKRVDVWTAGNRVFASHGTYVVAIILDALAEEVSPLVKVSMYLGRPLTSDESTKVEEVYHQLESILMSERCDIAGFWDRTILNNQLTHTNYKVIRRSTG